MSCAQWLKNLLYALRKLKQVDYMGSALTIAFATLICFALTSGGSDAPWVSARVLAPLIIGVLVLVVFVFWEGKFAKLPITPRESPVKGLFTGQAADRE